MCETLDVKCQAGCSVAGRVGAYSELIRLRIAVLVLIATASGFVLAPIAAWDGSNVATLFFALLGTALVAAGANTLNQVIESELDGRMVRTAGRPIPSDRLTRSEALRFGLLVGTGGVVLLGVVVNRWTGLIGLITLASYVLVYTPMKRVSWMSVFVGAVPGALPPVIGWTAATGSPAGPVWSLFLIILVWQLPHFAAIAWLHREDYARAGYPMLSVIDPVGQRLSRHMVATTLVLILASLLPVWWSLCGLSYGIGAIVLGAAFLGFSVFFSRRRTNGAAKAHLLASVSYLPVLMVWMMFDKVR